MDNTLQKTGIKFTDDDFWIMTDFSSMKMGFEDLKA